MKTLLKGWLAGWALMLMACSTPGGKPPATAGRVELEKYAGTWHEIARLPMPFQREGDAAMATYTPRADGKVGVHNVAVRPDGTKGEIRGTATVLNPGENTRLAVRFDTWFGPLIPVAKEGNYWILDVSPDYQRALVGTPDRRYLWLLARKPVIREAEEKAMVEKAAALGYAVEGLIRPAKR